MPESSVNRPDHTIVMLRQGDTLYGLNGGRVREILPTPRMSVAPRQPAYVWGICNYKGNMVPVLSLGQLCGVKASGEEPLCVIFEVDGGLFGLCVEAVSGTAYDSGREIAWDRANVLNENLIIRQVIDREEPVFVLDMPEILQHLKKRGE